MKSRLDFLDAFRGYAILIIILAHSTTHFIIGGEINPDSIPKNMLDLFWKGGLGVTLFFTVSSFTLTYVYKNKLNIIDFYVKRFFRIAPLYYLGIVLYGMFIYNVQFSDFDGLLKLATNLLFIHGFSSQWSNTLVPGGWSIGNEFIFYFLFPLFMRWLKSLNHLIVAFCISILIAKASLIILQRFLPHDDPFLKQNFLLFAPTFFTGMIAANIAFSSEVNVSERNWVLLLVLMLAQLLWGFMIYEDSWFALFFGLILILLSKGRLQLLINKPFVFLGSISYSLYITHFSILHLLSKFNYVVPFNSLFVNISYRFLLTLGSSIVLSVFTYNYIEKPFIKIGHNWLSKRIKT